MKILAKAVLVGLLAVASIGSVTAQSIMSRDDWGAKKGIVERMKRHSLQEIVVHHTGVKQQQKYSLKQKLRGLQSYSQGKKNWGDVPYHYYIDKHGEIGEGRSLKYSGDTNTGYNPANRIHVVLEGHFDDEVPSHNQVSALAALVQSLQGQYSIPSSKISGHKDHVSTDCPGHNLHPLVLQMAAGQAADLASNYVPTCSGVLIDDQCFSLNEVYKLAQTHLLQQGCYTGAIDGDWGPMSRGSLAGYNGANGTSFSMESPSGRKQFVEHLGTPGSRSCSN
ncbi:peptidoglycan recognition protein family protein [Alphaproteobacteria bacterium]|nr:peptidoglycan recognition protein family protein [Alphaproteobacteria bacterium]